VKFSKHFSCILSLLTLLTFWYSCDKDKKITGPTGSITFEISPLDYETISQATPLGNMNPPGHTFPTNHIGFYIKGTNLVEVKAMAAGTIRSVYYNSNFKDYRIEFKHTETFYSYFDHVKNLSPAIKQDAQVNIGDLIGYGDPAVAAIDLGVVDYDSTKNFIVPGRYHEFSLYCGNPYFYFVADVREKLLAKNPRVLEPRGGKIDFDRDGKLSGNWFLESTPIAWNASSYQYASSQLCFVYDMYDPTKIRISAGGTLKLAPFVYGVKGNTPDHGEISVSSGIIKYEITSSPTAVMLVQLIESRKIKAEVFPNRTKDQVAAFTSEAKIYVR
jgi:hypothetical protein